MPKTHRQEDTLLRLINDLHVATVRLFNHRAAAFGLTRAHWRVLAGLYRHNGLTQTELSKSIDLGRSPLGKTVDKLEACGLINRHADPDDRRVKRLHLTDKATPLIEPARKLGGQIEAKALAGIPSAERAILLSQLGLVRRALNAELESESLQ